MCPANPSFVQEALVFYRQSRTLGPHQFSPCLSFEANSQADPYGLSLYMAQQYQVKGDGAEQRTRQGSGEACRSVDAEDGSDGA
jgi:hypothetical protein